MRKRAGRLLSAAAAVILALSLCVPVFGAEAVYLRDDLINLELPDGWNWEEADPSESSGRFERIVRCDSGSGDPYTELNIYFSVEEISDYIYFNEDYQEALTYYDDYGESAIRDFYSENGDFSLVSLSEPETVQTEWIMYLKVVADLRGDLDGNGTGEDFQQLIYITASESVVNKLLVFSGNSASYRAEDMDAAALSIADSFYDFGYDEELSGISDASSPEDDSYQDQGEGSAGYYAGYIVGGIFAALIPFLIVIAVIVLIVVSRRRARRKAGAKASSKDRWRQNRKEENKRRKEEFRRRKARRDAAEAAAPEGSYRENVPLKAPEGDRYVESLRTLRKSGLLTREEMDEMVNKYIISKERYRRKK
ncbi:MAG TPA: hypothetical protein IAC50_06450 [Candidatus Copromorpha excrementigallinarum]|uniref:SHOCT domain-containing protein n=1 Tax=Candidatus Allocopromorpha excrementigallinarum TaxID=2840742 RepID=A0A9D1I1N4_9FIRM|nr:hypothetical protein [Candidatus Copromorpha excrementigallinarum]